MINNIDFVFFKIFTCPTISSPSLDGAMNFTSNETVTHDWLLLALYTAVPAPASINEQIKPPWVIWRLFKWNSFIIALN